MTFAITSPGWRTWVLRQPRNLISHTMIEWGSARARELWMFDLERG